MNGTVQISLNVTRRSPCVVLHAMDMEITHVALEHPHTHGAALHVCAVTCSMDEKI